MEARVAARTEAFRQMGAKLQNPYHYSATAENGDVVVQLWTDRFDENNAVYDDWNNPKLEPGAEGTKRPGVKMRTKHLLQAKDKRFKVVLGTAEVSSPDGKRRKTKYAAATEHLMEWTELDPETGRFKAKRVDDAHRT